MNSSTTFKGFCVMRKIYIHVYIYTCLYEHTHTHGSSNIQTTTEPALYFWILKNVSLMSSAICPQNISSGIGSMHQKIGF